VDRSTASGHSWRVVTRGRRSGSRGGDGSAVAARRGRDRGLGGCRGAGRRALLIILLLVQLARGILSQRARLLINADGVQLLALVGDDSRGRRAADVEEGAERLSDGGNVLLSDAKGRGGEADLGDEVGVLGKVEVHELVDLVHGRGRGVRVEAGHALLGAAQESTKEGVEMGEEEAASFSLVSFGYAVMAPVHGDGNRISVVTGRTIGWTPRHWRPCSPAGAQHHRRQGS
jgi:hypothetical protein